MTYAVTLVADYDYREALRTLLILAMMVEGKINTVRTKNGWSKWVRPLVRPRK